MGFIAILLHLTTGFLIYFNLTSSFFNGHDGDEYPDLLSRNGHGGMADRQRVHTTALASLQVR